MQPAGADFNPRSPWGERQLIEIIIKQSTDFNPRSPWGERLPGRQYRLRRSHFNPRSPWGERPEACRGLGWKKSAFQSTLPVGGATQLSNGLFTIFQFQSTLPVGGATSRLHVVFRAQAISIHAPRGGSDNLPGGIGYNIGISIHAPRGGSDAVPRSVRGGNEYFNPRSPWGERRASACPTPPPGYFNPRSPWGERRVFAIRRVRADRFQSTLPVGGATAGKRKSFPRRHNFNPRSPWGERPAEMSEQAQRVEFQSTLPVGGATLSPTVLDSDTEFQSTLPVGGATLDDVSVACGAMISIHAPRGGSDASFDRRHRQREISIHAPRGGSDSCSENRTGPSGDFNPRSPWGERPSEQRSIKRSFQFQSTLPVGGATSRAGNGSRYEKISIHAPRGGSDSMSAPSGQTRRHFNPRSPWGERQQRCTILGAHLWRRYIIFAHFREIGLSAWAASGESGGKQRSKSRANLPGIFCLPGLRNQRIRGASGI